MSKSKSGFTIVELLIVIVVIGVLAAITVVAYNGIQTKARNAQLLSAIDAYEKAIRMYMTDHDGWAPIVTDGDHGDGGVGCLGDQYPAATPYRSGECMKIAMTDGSFSQDIKASPSVNEALKPYISHMPTVVGNEISVADESMSIDVRGIQYEAGLPTSDPERYTAVIQYYIYGNQACGRGKPVASQDGTLPITLCQVWIR